MLPTNHPVRQFRAAEGRKIDGLALQKGSSDALAVDGTQTSPLGHLGDSGTEGSEADYYQ